MLTLRQIFHVAGWLPEHRIALARRGSLSDNLLANVSETSDGLLTALKEDQPFGEGPDEHMGKARVVSAWKKARSQVANDDRLRAKLPEDIQMVNSQTVDPNSRGTTPTF